MSEIRFRIHGYPLRAVWEGGPTASINKYRRQVDVFTDPDGLNETKFLERALTWADETRDDANARIVGIVLRSWVDYAAKRADGDGVIIVPPLALAADDEGVWVVGVSDPDTAPTMLLAYWAAFAARLEAHWRKEFTCEPFEGRLLARVVI